MDFTRRLTAAVVGKRMRSDDEAASAQTQPPGAGFRLAGLSLPSSPPSMVSLRSFKNRSRTSESDGTAITPTRHTRRPPPAPAAVASPSRKTYGDVLQSSIAEDPELAQLLKFKNPQEENEVLEGIEAEYFQPPAEVDIVAKLIHGLPEDSLSEAPQLVNRKRKLQRQLAVVSKRVSALILANESSCQAELERVRDLQLDLGYTLSIAVGSRVQLAAAVRHLTFEALSVVANHRKRRLIEVVLENLRQIKNLEDQERQVHQLLSEEAYPSAIQLILSLQQDAKTLSHFNRVQDLIAKLKDTLVVAREQMDKALSKMSSSFDLASFTRLQSAYAILGETQMALDQAHLHVTQALMTQSSGVLIGYVKMTQDHLAEDEVLKMPYHELCKRIPSSVFLGCLVDLCRSLWRVLWSYHCILKWYKMKFVDCQSLQGNKSDSRNMEVTLMRQYIKQKIAKGPSRVWQDLQAKVISLVVSVDLSEYSFDGFMSVMNVIHRIIEIGKEFCDASSEPMEDCLLDQSLLYLRSYHRQKMEQLKLFLENEGWTCFPVKRNFGLADIPEFHFIHQTDATHRSNEEKEATEEGVDEGDDEEDDTESTSTSAAGGGEEEVREKPTSIVDTMSLPSGLFFGREEDPLTSDSPTNPFLNLRLWGDGAEGGTGDQSLSPSRFQSKVRLDSLTDDEEEETAPYRQKEGGPILANTTLILLRQVGKYSRMMELLGLRAAPDVFRCITQLINYYLYAIHRFFGVVDVRPEEHRIMRTIRKIEEHLISDASSTVVHLDHGEEGVEKDGGPDDGKTDPPRPKDRFPSPRRMVDDADVLYATLVAGESVSFLTKQLVILRPHMAPLLPAHKQTFLQHFYSRVIEIAPSISLPLFRRIAANHFRWEVIIHSMAQVNWDVRDMKDKHNGYVDLLVEDVGRFRSRLQNVPVVVPAEAQDLLWTNVMKYALRIFVEGFSLAKKCSFQGRSWMLLDFRHFLQKAAVHCPHPCPPEDAAFVEEYIRVFYRSEKEISAWITDHSDYSTHHLLGLINCLSHVNKKSRQALIALVEEKT